VSRRRRKPGFISSKIQKIKTKILNPELESISLKRVKTFAAAFFSVI
jgi:hypothetical protein